MSEPMVSHDCVAFYLLSEEVSKHLKVVQSGQGADEVLGGYDWYPPLAGVPRDGAVEAYSRVFFDRRWSAMGDVLEPDWMVDDDAPTAFIAEQFGRPGAETSVDAALRNDTTIMLVDDPVKRVDNMTMAWGLEARVPVPRPRAGRAGRPHPAGAQARRRRQGRAQAGGPRRRARRGHRPHQGLLPRAGDPPARGPVPRPRARGPHRPRRQAARAVPPGRRGGHAARSPTATRTTLGSNALWQLALLEMWLQKMEDVAR